MSEKDKQVFAEEESLIEFPCRFPIKAMGSGMIDLEKTVLEIVQKHAKEISKDDIALLPSRNGRYLSVTVTINAQSRVQLDSIYLELTSHADILMVF